MKLKNVFIYFKFIYIYIYIYTINGIRKLQKGVLN